MSAGNIAIGMSANYQAFNADMFKAIKAIDRIAKTAEAAKVQLKGLDGADIRRAASGLTNVFSGIGAPLAALSAGFLAFKGASAIGDAVVAASDLNETLSKSATVFGPAAGRITAEAEKMAEAFGTAKDEFIGSAVNFGAVFKGAGVAADQAAELGNKLTKLGMDMASFDNTSTADAIQALGSALRGEFDPIEKFRVFLNADAVAAEALRMGLVKTGDEITDAAKKMATLNLIMSQSKDAQGDLQRTSGGLANKMREIWGRVSNLTTQLGSYLVPAAQSAAAILADIGKGLADVVARNSAMFAGWGERLKGFVDQIGVMWRNLDEFRKIGGLIFQDVGRNLWEVLKAALANLTNFATYFGRVIGQEVQKGVQNALSAAFSGTFLDPGQFEQRVVWVPPKIVVPDLKLDPEVGKTLEKVNAAEAARKAAPPVPRAAPPIDAKTFGAALLSGLAVAANPAMGDAAAMKKALAQPAATAATANATKPAEATAKAARPEVKLASAVEASSKEAYSAIVTNKVASDPARETAKTAKESLTVQKGQLAALNRISEKVGPPAEGPAVFALGTA